LILAGAAHGLRQLTETAAQKTGKPLKPAIEIDSYRQIKKFARRGSGFGLLPATAIKQEGLDGTFRSWSVTAPALMRRIYLCYPKTRPLSGARRAISELSLSILKALVTDSTWPAIWVNKDAPTA
jgi:LysR family nitrogen assimilation transcriptional regulator